MALTGDSLPNDKISYNIFLKATKINSVNLTFSSIIWLLVRIAEMPWLSFLLSTVPTAPTLKLSREPPHGIVNVTIVCISNASKENGGSAYNGQPYWIQFFLNDDDFPVEECGGHENDNEDSKVCKYSIGQDFGTYTCISHNQITCTEGTITVDYPGEL